ncbi:MAG: site-2 protease family protein [Clostridiales bacterium]|jgi:Zn-dependent protease|nr:site-2 protease family protein [Clostridiales bacterium]
MIFKIFSSGYAPRDILLNLVAYVFALLTALILHEVAHGYVAKLNGDDTAFLMGRLSLNPLKHLDPIGTICLLIVGFGWAKPVPVNSNNFRHFRSGLFTVSIAGIVMNLILAVFFAGIFWFLSAQIDSIPEATHEIIWILIEFVVYLSMYSVMINLMLMIFNLLPVYPLDGFRIVESLAKSGNKYVEFCRRSGSFLTLVVILAVNYSGILPTIVTSLAKLLGMPV